MMPLFHSHRHIRRVVTPKQMPAEQHKESLQDDVGKLPDNPLTDSAPQRYTVEQNDGEDTSNDGQ